MSHQSKDGHLADGHNADGHHKDGHHTDGPHSEGHHAGHSPSRRSSQAIDHIHHQHHHHHHQYHHLDGHGHHGNGHSPERVRRLSQHSKETGFSQQSHHLEVSDRHRRASRLSFSTEGGDHHDGIRRASHFSEATSVDVPRPVYYENTYKVEPDATFKPERVKPIIESVLRENLEGLSYDRHLMGSRCLLLSDIIKERVKQQQLPRFKIVCMVLIGENKKQTVMVSSRCLWNQSCDNFASCEYSKGNIYAVGMVFAVHQE
ncbi:Tctex1 domain-containing protein 1 [Bulinus truncatus]|nr:Tctex1 domain-containing protein 1 [Bulinus truncatus]